MRVLTYNPIVDVIAVNYRTPHDMMRFLDSVPEACGNLDYELYLANVDPTEDDLVVGSKYEMHHVIYDTNVGYARAVNSCSARSMSPYLAIFNVDVVLSPGSIQEAITVMEENQDWAILGPRQVNSAGKITHAGIFGPDDSPAHRGWMQRDDGQFSDIRDAYSVSGSAYFVRRVVWDELTLCPYFRAIAPAAQGAFLPTQLFYEETYCSVHARKHGHRVMYYGPIQVIHEWHQSVRANGGDEWIKESQQVFRVACEIHGIEHD